MFIRAKGCTIPGMIWTVLTVLIVFGLLVLAEYAARTKHIHAELTRKFVHMSVGTFVAFWPLFLSWRQIELLSGAFLVVILLSIKFHIFRSVHDVDRNVSGEILFAAAIGLLAFISSTKWIFMAAMLNLSLADGLAAIIGILYGDKNQYKVFGRTKSRAGTAAFLVTSLVITVFYFACSHAALNPIILVGLPLAATLAENVAVLGTDNIVMPLLVATILSGSV